uniref:Uncharacterized protein n=1 Tax=viral metagenome TaxID=1070528 RepID=A0A6C0JWX3_9ZZZZ
MSLREYQRLERYLADRPISENDQIDILDAYKAYLDALNTLRVSTDALETSLLAREDPDYKKLEDAWKDSTRVSNIAWYNYRDIYDRLFR